LLSSGSAGAKVQQRLSDSTLACSWPAAAELTAIRTLRSDTDRVSWPLTRARRSSRARRSQTGRRRVRQFAAHDRQRTVSVPEEPRFVLSKDTRFAGGQIGEIRFEILNLTNTAKFGNDSSSNNVVNGSSFGRSRPSGVHADLAIELPYRF